MTFFTNESDEVTDLKLKKSLLSSCIKLPPRSAGSVVGQLLVYDADEEGTLNSQLTYNITMQHPDTSPKAFSIDAASGDIQALRILQRKEQKLYDLTVRVNDPGKARLRGGATHLRSRPSLTVLLLFVVDFSTDCKVFIKVIDVNNEIPVFEKTDVRRL